MIKCSHLIWFSGNMYAYTSILSCSLVNLYFRKPLITLNISSLSSSSFFFIYLSEIAISNSCFLIIAWPVPLHFSYRTMYFSPLHFFISNLIKLSSLPDLFSTPISNIWPLSVPLRNIHFADLYKSTFQTYISKHPTKRFLK